MEETIDSRGPTAGASMSQESDDVNGAAQPSESIPEEGQDDSPIENDFKEAAQLESLGLGIRDQADLERDIGRQADQLLLDQADERDQRRLEKVLKDKDRLSHQTHRLEAKLKEFGNHATKTKYRAEIEHHTAQIAALDVDVEQIQKRIDDRHKEQHSHDSNAHDSSTAAQRLPGESQREFLIRTGKITPFSNIGKQLLKSSSNLEDVLIDAENETQENGERAEQEQLEDHEPVSHRNLQAPGFKHKTLQPANTVSQTDQDAELARKLQDEEFASERPAKRRRVLRRHLDHDTDTELVGSDDDDSGIYTSKKRDNDSWRINDSETGSTDNDQEVMTTTPGTKRRQRKNMKSAPITDDSEEAEDLAGIDDGDEQVYYTRLRSWSRRRSVARREQQASAEIRSKLDDDFEGEESLPRGSVAQQEDEWLMPHPTRPDADFEGGFRMPGDIYPNLFDYQKTGVQWLWELYSQQVGGIIGDEMGLGKTIQAIAFLAGLHHSGKLKKPVIVVCPATVMKQWVSEFHRWWPPLRVSILHTSGSGMLNVRQEALNEDDLENGFYSRKPTKTKGHTAAKRIVDKVVRNGHVLVTTYSGLQTYAELLIPTDWEYAVLDEGHKIRNPNTSITVYCKELRTHNRIILSGTPMQNNLTELWSLFDFIFPMRLGTLVNFRNQFEIPIKQGGYANASNLQVETAMKCAETLKDTVSPYLLQRFKADVAADLPKKSERVLFCRLTQLQRDAYEWFLASEDMKAILAGKRQALYGVDILRKICNHPDLVEHKTLSKKVGYAYGDGRKSGKMQVVKALLDIWKKNGHKTLLFAQHRIMLDILEDFIRGLLGFKYCRMDGNTSIKDRQDLVDEFNRNPDLHVFLLTTKVGGLGVNLTGANRVIIYDPDWNPSTDVQARERAWRLGQKREVEIYRLMTAGTIEEKIYHRQIFKQFLTNKILRDPKQRQTFQLRDLHDLFTFDEMQNGMTETGSIFAGSEVRLSGPQKTGQESPIQENKDFKNIAGISREENYRSEDPNDSAVDAEQSDPKAAASNRDDRILSSIFAGNGVHSALEHDAIINGRKTVRADPEMIAREAKRVAAKAAKELQLAGDVARSIPAGEVTWTGQVGTAGRPDDLPRSSRRGGHHSGRGGRAGPSSSSVLANLQSRGNNETSSRSSTPSGRRTPGAPLRSDTQPVGKDFLVLLRDYLLAQGGSAYTQMLIDHFNRFCRTEQRTAEFKEMLKTIAVLEKGSRSRGKWVLRDEYKPPDSLG